MPACSSCSAVMAARSTPLVDSHWIPAPGAGGPHRPSARSSTVATRKAAQTASTAGSTPWWMTCPAACWTSSASATITRPVRKPCQRRTNGASTMDEGWPADMGMASDQALVLLPVLRAAKSLVAEHQGFGPGNVQAAVRAGEYVRGGPRCGPGLGRSGIRRAAAAPDDDGQRQNQQQDQVLHVLRPKTTSSTKREPAKPRSSKAEPVYSTRTALRPRQPNSARPSSKAAKVSHDSSENTALWSQRQARPYSASPNSQPASSVAVSSTKPAPTKRNVSRSSVSSGRPPCGSCPWRIWRSARVMSQAWTTAAANKP